MKKLALLQLMLLPLAGMADVTSASEGPAQVRGEQPLAEIAWENLEDGATAFARRLVGVGYAQSLQHGSGPAGR
jgi:hypothetical protein